MKVYIVKHEWWSQEEEWDYSEEHDDYINTFKEAHNERTDAIFSSKKSAKKYVAKKNAKLDPDKARYWVATNPMMVRK